MKAKRYTISILSYLLLGFCGCHKKDVIPISSLSCKWPDYNSVQAKITDVITTVQATHNDTVFVFRNPTPSNENGSQWLPCNMPQQAKKAGMKVKISGYIITFPGIELSSLIYGRPFELISIEYLQ
ncbi:hypothetical protein [Runella sp.]|uniref:hypothetical protein n=1 Tax=Runella sp. TaxID=1960881 RepID=UPI003D12938A